MQIDLDAYERLVLAEMAREAATEYRRLARVPGGGITTTRVLINMAERREAMADKLHPGTGDTTTTTGGASES